ncbi:hypothetical protein KAU51_04450 [Candidatus Parcubacteria bacterium]|nr:hypothetical protein [Candidatus Parcubacteria bacterium]
MADKNVTRKEGGKRSGSRKPSDITEHRSKQGKFIKDNVKGYSSIIDTHPPPDKKPKK